MCIHGQGHFLTFAKGHFNIKIQACFSENPVELFWPNFIQLGTKK